VYPVASPLLTPRPNDVSSPAKRLRLFVPVLAFLTVGPSAPAEPPALQVTYTGARGAVSGALQLWAQATTKNARVVAVTYRLDGKPLVSSTVAGYHRTMSLPTLPTGRHTLVVAAVDSLGRRARTGPVRITLPRKLPHVLTVSPRKGLSAGLSALARGGTVRFLPGRYALTDVRLGTGAELIGSGPTTVFAAPSSPYRSILIASGRNIKVSNLTLNGGGPGGGAGNGVEVVTGSADVLIRRVRIVNVRKLGIFAWGAYSQVSLQDSTVDGGGTADAGYIAGESGSYGASRDSSVIRTTIRRFRNWGVLFAHQAFGKPDGALHAVALDDLVTDIRGSVGKAPGTAEGGIWSGSVEGAIIGNAVLRAGWDGIETVGSSDRATVVANRVASTKTGIYIEHSTNDSLIARNQMSAIETGIIVEWTYGGISSKRNTFLANRIVGASRIGLVVSIGADQNQIADNVFVGGGRPMIVLQGSSDNIVRGNQSCGTKGTPLVAEESAPDEHGTPTVPKRNVIRANTHRVTCG
jgi:hypothetical protein